MNNYNNVNPTPAEIRKTLLSLPTNVEQELNPDETLEDIENELKKEQAMLLDPERKKAIEIDLKRIAILKKQQEIADKEMKRATSIKSKGNSEKQINKEFFEDEIIETTIFDTEKNKEREGFDRGERTR